MERAKEAVAAHLEPHNHHSVDIEQVASPAVTHERVQTGEHHNVTTAIDREIHQHHYQTHVQPVAHKEVLPEEHHHKIHDVERRHHHHGKDAEVEAALAEQAAQFKDTREVLPTQVSQSENTVVGEHVHHHIHDVIQPVVEKETVQQHVVHHTKPISERIDKEPVMHQGNVLPMKTMEDFLAGGHSLEGGHHNKEHIDYTGDPLKIKGNSDVGFSHTHRHQGLGTVGAPGEMGTDTGLAGAAGITGGHHHHHHGHHHGTEAAGAGTALGAGSLADRELASGTTGTTGATGVSGAGPHGSRVANELDPRVDSDGSKGLGAGATTSGTTGTGVNTTSGLGENITHKNTLGNDSSYTTGTGIGTGTAGPTTTGTSSTYDTTPRTAGADSGYGNTAGTGLGSGNTGVTESAGTNTVDTDVERKPSTTQKLLSKVGL